mgnify:CR=1 FL=1
MGENSLFKDMSAKKDEQSDVYYEKDCSSYFIFWNNFGVFGM